VGAQARQAVAGGRERPCRGIAAHRRRVEHHAEKACPGLDPVDAGFEKPWPRARPEGSCSRGAAMRTWAGLSVGILLAAASAAASPAAAEVNEITVAQQYGVSF